MTVQDGGPSTEQRILRAAFQLFHEQGYHATGVATILREAGVNPGSMYHLYPGKDALLLGVLRFALGFLRPAVIDPVEAVEQDPLGRVFALLAQYRQGMVLRACKLGCPIGNLALEVSDDQPAARQLVHENFENWTTQVQAWLIAAGDRLPASCDRRSLARFVLTVMEGGLMQARAAGHLAPFDQSVDELRRYISALEAQAELDRKPQSSKRRPKSPAPSAGDGGAATRRGALGGAPAPRTPKKRTPEKREPKGGKRT